MMLATSSLVNGYLVVGSSMFAAALVVLLMRRRNYQSFLDANREFIGDAYPIIGLVYGVFLAFTVVIAWEKFNEAEESAAQETTHLSQLWRNATVFRPEARLDVQRRLSAYVESVRTHDWPRMAEEARVSAEGTEAYERIWDFYYSFRPEGAEDVFFQASIGELNALGRARRLRNLYASSEVQPLVKLFLVGGGVLTVAFSLLVACASIRLQATITALIAGLVSFSIFLVLSLQRPFEGDLSVDERAFRQLARSFEHRTAAAEHRAAAATPPFPDPGQHSR